MKYLIFLFTVLLFCFGCNSPKFANETKVPQVSKISSQDTYSIECYSCALSKEVKCRDCRSEISATLFSGIVLSSRNAKDIPLHKPIKVTTVGRTFYFEDPFGATAQLHINQIEGFGTPISLLNYLAECSCTESSDFNTDYYAGNYYDSLGMSNEQFICTQIVDNNTGDVIQTQCIEVQQNWNCDSTLNCVNQNISFTADTTFVDNQVTVENCIVIGTNDPICDSFVIETLDCDDIQNCVNDNLNVTSDTTINGDIIIIENCVQIGANTPVCSTVEIENSCHNTQYEKTITPALDVVTYACPIPSGATNVQANRRGKIYCASQNEFTWDGSNVTWAVNNLHADVADNCTIKITYEVCE